MEKAIKVLALCRDCVKLFESGYELKRTDAATERKECEFCGRRLGIPQLYSIRTKK